MERKYYTGEQILDALYEVGVSAGDISEVMSCLGRMPSAEPNLITRLSDIRSQYSCFNESERDAYHTLSEAIEVLQEPKTGKWVYDKYYLVHVCSECDEQALEEYTVNPRTLDRDYDEVLSEYCPHCGAKMEVDMEEESDEDEDD